MPQFPASEPAVSLVICTRNRARQLQTCLAAVARIRCRQPWETVIVDNGSNDDTRAIAQVFLRDEAVDGCYVWEPRPGLSRARNAGLDASRATIIAFTDDDCYPAADFLERVCEVFADPRIGFMGGRILLHDPADYPLTINESLETLHFAAGGIVPCAAVQGANMAFRRAALIGVGGFDPMLGAGTPFPAEDWDAVARVCMSGWDGGYFPEPTVSHHHGRTADDASRQLATYHYASGAVYAKLVMDPATRRTYRRYWARRILGDSKYHRRKLVQQFRGAVDYWRSVRREARRPAENSAAPGPIAPVVANPRRER
ncbi:MAG TPA: glycosyltransferase [Stellaceae bacterium]|nr:glycosyltransferase [Stellaceae bacterium]